MPALQLPALKRAEPNRIRLWPMVPSLSSTATMFLDLPGGRIAFDIAGPDDGPLIVCLHGMGDTRRAFRFLTPA